MENFEKQAMTLEFQIEKLLAQPDVFTNPSKTKVLDKKWQEANDLWKKVKKANIKWQKKNRATAMNVKNVVHLTQ